MQSLDFLGFERYAVTSCGKVWSHTSNRFLTNYSNKKHHDKYCRVSLSNYDKKVKVSKVHRLVAYAFLEKPFGKDHVNHIDGDIYNNHVDNLEWCTPTENNTHSMDNVRKGQFLEDQSKNITQNGFYFIHYILIDEELVCKILDLTKTQKKDLKQYLKIGLLNKLNDLIE